MTRHSQEKTGEKNFPKMTQKWLQEGVGSDKPTALSKVTALVDGGLPSFDARHCSAIGRMLISCDTLVVSSTTQCLLQWREIKYQTVPSCMGSFN